MDVAEDDLPHGWWFEYMGSRASAQRVEDDRDMLDASATRRDMARDDGALASATVFASRRMCLLQLGPVW